jgi:hypothetical protein
LPEKQIFPPLVGIEAASMTRSGVTEKSEFTPEVPIKM